MLDEVEGGYTKGPDGRQTSIFEAAMAYQKEDVPLVIFVVSSMALDPAGIGRRKEPRFWGESGYC